MSQEIKPSSPADADRRRRAAGQGMVEYAIILILVSVVVVVVLVTQGAQLKNLFSNVVCAFQTTCTVAQPRDT